MIYKEQAYIRIVVSAIILIIAIITTKQIYNGSKSKFAYTLLAFTFGYPLAFLLTILALVYP